MPQQPSRADSDSPETSGLGDRELTTSNHRRARVKRTRGRTGCLNCRRRRKKCDEKKPSCSKCRSQGEKCEWDSGLTFKVSGIDSGNSSMRQSPMRSSDVGNSKTCNEYRIVDMTLDTSRRHARRQAQNTPAATGKEAQGLTSVPDHQRPWDWAESQKSPTYLSPDTHRSVQSPLGTDAWAGSLSDQSHHQNAEIRSNGAHSIINTMGSSPVSQHPLASFDYAPRIDSQGHSSLVVSSDPFYSATGSSSGPHARRSSSQAEAMLSMDQELRKRHSSVALTIPDSTVFTSNSDPSQPSFDAIEMEALDFLMSDPTINDLFPPTIIPSEGRQWSPSDQNLDVVPIDQVIAESPDMYAAYYPDPTYKELHTVFHNYMVETARMTGITRQGTPETKFDDSTATENTPTNGKINERAAFGAIHSLTGSSEDVVLTSRRELELWQNYLDEVAVWLDMFDVERHFQLKIPILAKSADHLRYSILALSARQRERVDPDKPYTESLTLYQKAIKLIVLELDSLDTAVIASCILLCVLEMMSSSPKAWGRHLEGCSMLLQAAGINGTVGGVRQALFWCFARMDVWGGFLSDTLTKIPTSGWFIPSQSMSMAVARFKTGTGGFDHYANYAVFLCASVINVLSNRSQPVAGGMDNLLEANVSYSARWKALFDLLEDWYVGRPQEMLPLMSTPATLEDHSHPFPIILYGNSPAVNGNQLYHASSLLILQEKPKDIWLPKSQKSIHWHARQICGIAVSNNNHGAWINALQPLWMAGKVMSHPIEHQVVLGILARIEKETGWATSWRAEDLKDYWGDTD